MVTDPIEEFLTWPEIVSTMVVGEGRIAGVERNYLVETDDVRWSRLVGREYRNRPNSNLVHQAYHLAMWERETGRRISDLSRIVEIGGGYGALCSIIRRAGFIGDYIIYDVPELSTLQQFYLKEMNASAQLKTSFQSDKADLLIGLFSLSEVGKEALENYLDNIETKHVLLAALNDEWEGWNSVSTLKSYFPNAREFPIAHIPGRLYLIE
jgi:hypothetical protein